MTEKRLAAVGKLPGVCPKRLQLARFSGGAKERLREGVCLLEPGQLIGGNGRHKGDLRPFGRTGQLFVVLEPLQEPSAANVQFGESFVGIVRPRMNPERLLEEPACFGGVGCQSVGRHDELVAATQLEPTVTRETPLIVALLPPGFLTPLPVHVRRIASKTGGAVNGIFLELTLIVLGTDGISFGN